MKRCTAFFLALSACVSITYSASVVSPLFAYKDGEASVYGSSGFEENLIVDNTTVNVVSWITFITDSTDLQSINRAYLSLYVEELSAPGNLKAYALSEPITTPEYDVLFEDIFFNPTNQVASIPLTSDDIRKVLFIDITDAVKDTAFFGIVLSSDDGLQASFSSREGNRPPVILMHTDVTTHASITWLSGEGIPAASTGSNGCSYIDISTGDLYTNESGKWNFALNIMGPRGDRGKTGPEGTPPDGNSLIASLNRASDNIAFDRLPVGTAAETVARGDHNHDDLYYMTHDNRSALLTGNLIPNADFSRGSSQWTAVEGNDFSVINDVKGPFGSNAVQNIAGTGAPTWLSSEWISVNRGESYRIRVAFRLTDNRDPTGSVYLAIRLKDIDNSEFPDNAPDTCWMFPVSNFSPADMEWHTFSVCIGTGTSYPFPENAGSVSIGAILNADPNKRSRSGNRIFQAQGFSFSSVVVPDFGQQNIITKGNASIGGTLTTAGAIRAGSRIKDLTGFIMPVGAVLPYAGKTAPEGWLLCRGDTVLISDYPDLYATIDTVFGSCNDTAFLLPDLCRRVPVGAGGDPVIRTTKDVNNEEVTETILGNTVGQTGGEPMHILTKEEMPSHSHSYRYFGTSQRYDKKKEGTGVYWNPSEKLSGSSGNDKPHNNIQPSIILNYIIKY